MTRRITPTQARTVGRVLRAEIARLRGRREAPAATAEASQMTVPDGAQDGGRYVS